MSITIKAAAAALAALSVGAFATQTAVASAPPVVTVCPTMETVTTHNPTNSYTGNTGLTINGKFIPGPTPWINATSSDKKKVDWYPDFDSVDDAAIWIHPTNPSQSLIINTDKSDHGGYNLYNLDGSEHHWVQATAGDPTNRLNNVDLRYNFQLGSQRVALVGFSVRDRTTPRLAFYRVDPATRRLVHINSPRTSTAQGIMPRGFAMYHSPNTGKYYAFVTDSGKTDQYELDGSTGTVRLTLVRTLPKTVMSSEGLVADDEHAYLYLAEEANSGQDLPGHIWKFNADPGTSTTPTEVARTTDGTGPLAVVTPDIKGLSMYYASDGRGYLISASQGKEPGKNYSAFGVFDRQTGAYKGSFALPGGSCSIDAVAGEDGIDVTNFNLGSAYPSGLFVTGDFDNTDSAGALQRQNNKVVRWDTIAAAFTPDLVVDNSWDPRKIGAGGGTPGDTTPPTVSLTAPTSGAVVAGNVTLSATASDVGTGVSQVRFLVDGVQVASDTTSPYSATWVTGAYSNGDHQITAVAVDGAGNDASTSRTVRVNNVAPPVSGTRILSLRVGTNIPLLVASSPAGSVRQVAYSHNLRRIAYVSTAGIVVANANGTGARTLAGTAGARDPEWGAGDARIIYIKSGSVYSKPTAGGTARRLAAGRVIAIAASPDGKRVAYQRVMSNGKADIWTMLSSTGAGKRNLTRTTGVGESQPAWVSNAQVAFAKRVAGKWAVYRMPSAGGTIRRVSSPSLNCQQPAYAPGGARLACVQVGAARNRVAVLRANGTRLQWQAIAATRPAQPAWGSTSSFAYTSN